MTSAEHHRTFWLFICFCALAYLFAIGDVCCQTWKKQGNLRWDNSPKCVHTEIEE